MHQCPQISSHPTHVLAGNREGRRSGNRSVYGAASFAHSRDASTTSEVINRAYHPVRGVARDKRNFVAR